MSTLKDRLKSGETLVGTGGGLTAPADIAVIADSGFDFILFDTQHTPVEIKELKAAVEAVSDKKAAPFIRVSDNRSDLICFALDIGARGIVVPMVNTKDEAAAMVSSCMYSPVGDRSNSGPRGEWDREFNDYREYLDYVNEELFVIPMIETKRAVDDIDELLSVSGIDVLLVGPSDLSIGLEVPLQFESDTYQRGLDRIAEACAKRGVVPGMYFIPPNMDPNFFVEKGFKLFTLPWAGWASEGIKNGLAGIKR